MISDIERQYAIEQFYYREAGLLDGRQYQQWLSLVSESIRYIVPARVNALVNNRQRGEEVMIAIDNELEGSDGLGCPIREESYAHLFVRVDRAYKMNSWADNPPARTRRIIGNVEVLDHSDESVRVRSNFHLFFARPGSDNFIYSGQRNDQLLIIDGNFKIADREVIMDYANIDVPTLGLIF
ncbi:MAG: aromatic-ring-hydroxylating dioxygenase subunit beta [Pseudomonadales bacterium]|nr:aromatic-ring-hydroxylating dioxygenase subunit beta [Pseudomonadales bacterium]